jgi:hypothetical protein
VERKKPPFSKETKDVGLNNQMSNWVNSGLGFCRGDRKDLVGQELKTGNERALSLCSVEELKGKKLRH